MAMVLFKHLFFPFVIAILDFSLLVLVKLSFSLQFLYIFFASFLHFYLIFSALPTIAIAIVVALFKMISELGAIISLLSVGQRRVGWQRTDGIRV